jgi:periplasmic protein TonB
MKKSALLLTTFILLGACQEESVDLPNTEVENPSSEIEIIEVPDVEFEDEIFLVVEEQASFKGGRSAWIKFVNENLRYPEQAKRMGIEGRVYLSFIVDKQGQIHDIKIARGIGAGCDQAALEMLKTSPEWMAGKQRGRDVNSRMQVAVTFKLAE